MKTDDGFAEEVLAKAVKHGADQAEIFIKSSRNLSVEIKSQSVDSLRSSLSYGYSLRIIKKRRLGFAYSNSTEEKDEVIKNALEAADYTEEDNSLDLPEASNFLNMEMVDPEIGGILGVLPGPYRKEDAIDKVMLIERSLYEEDKRIKKLRKAAGSFTYSETGILNSKSLKTKYAATSCSAQATAIAAEGRESQMGWDFEGSRFLREISFENVGRNAAKNAVRLLGSRKIEGRKACVILDNSVAADFVGIFASLVSSEAVQKGKSLLAGKRGKKVMSSRINLKDSGLLQRKLGSSPVDDEGVPAKEKVVIKEGVLVTYLHNTYTAKKDNTSSTGNAVRGSYAALPSVGVANFFIEPALSHDALPKDKIFSTIDKGLYVVDAMGVHTANPISGEFSIGVSGIWIELGEPKYPVKEAVISGNILEFFDKIEAVGDDLRFYGNIGAPSLIIRDVDISA
jgi:PmbA protein